MPFRPTYRTDTLCSHRSQRDHLRSVRKDADNNLGAHFVDLEEIAEPVAPTVKRRIFVNSADGELSIRKDDGTTRSLESAGGNTITRGAAASRPVSGSVAGDLYSHSDEPYYSLWNGSSWVLLLRGGQWAVTEPAASGWVNQSDANVNTNFGGIRIDIPPRAVAPSLARVTATSALRSSRR